MSGFDDEFKHESLEDRESIVKYFNALGEGFLSGRLFFGTDKKKLVMEPQGLLNLSVKAKRKNKKIKLNIKLSWVEEKENKDKDVSPLVIKAAKDTKESIK